MVEKPHLLEIGNRSQKMKSLPIASVYVFRHLSCFTLQLVYWT
jgi:hypothetical protein